MDSRGCTINECGREHYARGWCYLHWKRWLRHGDPETIVRVYLDPEEAARRTRAGQRRWAEAHRAKITTPIRAAKATPCLDCGIEWPYYVMHLDHVRGPKLFNLGQAVRLGKTVEEVLAEIAKCEAVCGNCHAIRTHQRRQAKAI